MRRLSRSTLNHNSTTKLCSESESGDNEMQTGSPHSDFTIYKHAAALPRTIRSNIIFAQN